MLRAAKSGVEKRDARKPERWKGERTPLVGAGCHACIGYVAELRHGARHSAQLNRSRRLTAERGPW